MIRVSVEVRSGAAHFRAAVWAESIERAICLTSARYPGCEARVLFPIDSEAFFIKELGSASGTVRPEAPEEATG
jgi:hypothetical protein